MGVTEPRAVLPPAAVCEMIFIGGLSWGIVALELLSPAASAGRYVESTVR